MASIDWKKMRTVSEAKATLRHNDFEERMRTQLHSNAELNKGMTKANTSVMGLSYSEACERYENRLNYLDEHSNKNKRKDRVTCISLCVPAPENFPEDKEEAWFKDVAEIIKQRYGADNIIEGYIHRDEKHKYVDVRTGEEKLSRSHMHVSFVPELNGQLNAKNIMTRSEMRQINAEVDAMSKERYNAYFLNGTLQRSQGSVESLKTRSELLKIENEKKIIEYRDTKSFEKAAEIEYSRKKNEERAAALDERENSIAYREQALAIEKQTFSAEKNAWLLKKQQEEYELTRTKDELKKKAEYLGIVEKTHKRAASAEALNKSLEKPKVNSSRFDKIL